MFLSKSRFQQVIHDTPLVSIDLLVKNAKGEYLLGQRANEPAKGFWFVPGGRILKNETLESCFLRLTQEELNCVFSIGESIFKGVFQHFYDTSMFDDEISTHYLALAFQIDLKENFLKLESDYQHSKYCWMSPQSINVGERIHQYTRDYFSSL